MIRHLRSVWIGFVALLAALCFAPGAQAQVEGTPVATEPAFGRITVVTVDQGGAALAGACYNLAVNGVLVAGPVCAGQQGVVVFSDLPADGSSYTIAETRAPAGCEGQEVPGLTLTPDNPDQTQTVTNDCGADNGVTNNQNPGQNGNQSVNTSQPPWTGTLTIHTVDQNGNALAGACYTLGTTPGFFAPNGTCSGPDGTVVFSGFWARDGNVQLTQTAASPGCQINGAFPPLTFSKASPTQELTVTDTCQLATNARNVQNAQPVVPPAQGTRDAASRIGADLPPVAIHALAASLGTPPSEAESPKMSC